MKKYILIVLAVVGFVCMGCNSESSDSPSARLQGKWYGIGSSGNLLDYCFIEFKGNTMRYYDENWFGETKDSTFSFTCTETVVTATWTYEDNGIHHKSMTIHYAIEERKTLSGIYIAFHIIEASTLFMKDSYWYKKN